MNGNNWKRRLHQLMETVERESTTALREISGYFEALSQPFDEKFRQHYLEMSTIRLNTSFDTVRVERRFDNEMVPHSSASILDNGMANKVTLLSPTQDHHVGLLNAMVNELKSENNIAAPIEISDSDDEDSEIQQVPAQNDSIPKTNRGDVKLDHQQFDLVCAASSEPDLNRERERLGIKREATIAGQCSSKNLPSNSEKQSKPDANGFYKCKVCEYSTQVKFNFYRHQLKHNANAVKPFTCEHCDYATRRKLDLQRHQRMHEQQQLMGIVPDQKDGMFKCTLCDQEFTKWYAFTKHFTQSHKSNQRLFNCAKCMRPFTQKGERDRHEIRCENHRYECYLCKNYRSTSKFHMQEHMRTHSGAKPFECMICNRNFSLKSCLRRHLNSVHKHNKS